MKIVFESGFNEIPTQVTNFWKIVIKIQIIK